MEPVNSGAETAYLYLVAFHSWLPYFSSGSPIYCEQWSARERERDTNSKAELKTGLSPVRLFYKGPECPHLPEISAPIRRWPLFFRVKQIPCVFSGTLHQPGYPFFCLYSTIPKAVFNDIETCWSQNCEDHWLPNSSLVCKPNISRMRKMINP